MIIAAAILAACLCSGCDAIHSPFEDYNDLTVAECAAARRKMWDTRDGLHDLDDVRRLMRGFVWIHEPVDWWPTVEFCFSRMDDDGRFYGDCQTSAVMGHWALGVIGVPSTVYIVSDGGEENHVIVVANGGWLFIDGGEVFEVASGDWRDAFQSLHPGFRYFRRRP